MSIRFPYQEARAKEIMRLRVEDGLTYKDLAEKFKISPERVRQILLDRGRRMRRGALTKDLSYESVKEMFEKFKGVRDGW